MITVKKIKIKTAESMLSVAEGYISWDTHREAEKLRGRKIRVYPFLTSESVMDNLSARYDRTYTEVGRVVMPAVLAELGLPANTKYGWNQKAGCSCGCSPGFVVQATGAEVFVDYAVEG